MRMLLLTLYSHSVLPSVTPSAFNCNCFLFFFIDVPVGLLGRTPEEEEEVVRAAEVVELAEGEGEVSTTIMLS